MKKWILVFITFVIMSILYLFEADAQTFEEFFIYSVPRSIEGAIRQVFIPPANTKDSIRYLLYTRSNPKEACFIEPTPAEFDHCHFDPNHDTKILIHGFVVTVNTEKHFEKHTGARYSSFHVIGHSLGAHISGIVGKHSNNLARITGLDPAGPLYELDSREHQLYYTDAEFVDVIHSSDELTGAQSFDDFFGKSVPGSAVDLARQVFVPPANTNDSIQYSLFTRSNPRDACFIEPTSEEFDHCPFDPNLETKILIHGFIVTVETYKSFVLIKDALLKNGSYNVIYVHWNRYNGHPYPQAVKNTVPVGKKIAEFIKFIKKHTGAKYSSFHLIGHSLGAHISGIVGKNVCNLGRITGLDPAGPLYELNKKKQQLYYTDAKFVDVIHTSDELTGQGLGKLDPIGHMDFYPNGGRVQMEACNTAKEANASDDTLTELESPYYVTICNHKMSIKFFLHSILDCDYLSTKCEEYESLPICSSKGNPTAKMGFFAKSIKDIKPAQSKFYLKTSGNKPFC